VIRIAAPMLALSAILLFTPIGGYINYFLSGTFVLLAIYLFFSGVAEIFSFRDWNYWPHWLGILKRLGGAFALIALIITIQLILPPPPISNRDCESFEGRSGSRTMCRD